MQKEGRSQYHRGWRICFVMLALFGWGQLPVLQVRAYHAKHTPLFTGHARSNFNTEREQIQHSRSGSIATTLHASRSPRDSMKSTGKNLLRILTNNPLAKSISNTYSFFYWFPRENLLYDSPFEILRNSTADFLRWYQIPHNLPPYRFLGTYHPDDFFCFGLVGNTLPLGNWDPWGLHQVSPAVVKRYRESELKHGRLAMLATVGFLIQELSHPLHPEIGGLSVTHMDQLAQLTGQSVINSMILQPIFGALNTHITEIPLPLDFMFVWLVLLNFEARALVRNWTRWKRNEYNHQFDYNIGIGNLKEDYENGDYGFDPLKLLPEDPLEKRAMQESELNNGRLAMIAAVGLIVQEYVTGVPSWTALDQWLDATFSTTAGAGAGAGDGLINSVINGVGGSTMNAVDGSSDLGLGIADDIGAAVGDVISNAVDAITQQIESVPWKQWWGELVGKTVP